MMRMRLELEQALGLSAMHPTQCKFEQSCCHLKPIGNTSRNYSLVARVLFWYGTISLLFWKISPSFVVGLWKSQRILCSNVFQEEALAQLCSEEGLILTDNRWLSSTSLVALKFYTSHGGDDDVDHHGHDQGLNHWMWLSAQWAISKFSAIQPPLRGATHLLDFALQLYLKHTWELYSWRRKITGEAPEVRSDKRRTAATAATLISNNKQQ